MKNPQIELVKKWLDDPKSVSADELERAADAAGAVAAAVYRADAAVYRADAAVYRADAADAAVKYWVEKYEELTK